jgi:predicted transcriptional regulator
MNPLTKGEERLMKILWKLKKAFLKDLIDEFPEPKPAKTTVATFLKRMVEKEAVGYNEYGRLREYYPKVSKTEYFSGYMKSLVKNFFNNSNAQFASFFTEESDMSVEELEALQKVIKEEIKKKKQ